MPTCKITGVVVSHQWDDESSTDYTIKLGTFEGTGPYVSLSDSDDTVYLRPESWDEIRDQIQCMMDDINNQ